MKKLGTLFLLFAGIFGTLQADEEAKTYARDSFIYGTLGTTMPGLMLPVFGLGVRGQSGHNGFDASLQGAGLVDVFGLKANLSYLYYFKPNLNHQFYTGLGLGVGQGFVRDYRSWDSDKRELKAKGMALAPEITFGKQYRSDTGGTRFFEAQISPVSFTRKGSWVNDSDVDKFRESARTNWAPVVVVRYGIAF